MTSKFVRVLSIMVMLLGLECIYTWAAVSARAESGAGLMEVELPSYISVEGVQGRFTDCGIQYHVSSRDPAGG